MKFTALAPAPPTRHEPDPPLPARARHFKRGDEIIFFADQGRRICGTLRLRLGARPLLAEAAYRDEIHALRRQGLRLAELTGLVVQAASRSQRVLNALFDHAWHTLHNQPHLHGALIEVHPRHASFYQRRFGFERIAGPRVCPRADALSVLLLLRVPALCRLTPREPISGTQNTGPHQ